MTGRKDDRHWVRLDAGYFDHPKTLAAGRDGWTLDLVAWTWSRQQLTDGQIPAQALPLLAFKAGLTIDAAQAAADRLIEVKRWTRTAEGWAIHDYEVHQFTTAELEDIRAKARARQARWRAEHDATRMSRVTNALVTHPETESESESETEKSLQSPEGEPPARARAREATTDETTATPDPRAGQALSLIGQHLAAQANARSPRSYARTVVADPERRAALAALAAAHPQRDAAWLAREHLGQPHPVEPCGNCRSVAHRTADCPIPPMERP